MVRKIQFISDKKIAGMRACLTFILLFSTFALFAQKERPLIRHGNKQYDKQKYADAETDYRKALDTKPKSFEAAFNVGDALYKQGKYADAANQFGSLLENQKDKDKLSRLYYNQGNAYLKDKKFKESIDAYKKALKITPKDADAKSNLAYAQRYLKQQEEKKKQDQKNKDKNKDKNKNKDKDKDKKDQDKKDQNKDKDKDKDKKDQDKQISPEDAQRMLDAIQNDEKDLQKKLKEQKAHGEKVKVLKNW